MRAKITTLPEAKQRLAEVIEGANEVAAYLADLSKTLGLSVVTRSRLPSRQANNGVAKDDLTGMPDAMTDRILRIISEESSIKAKGILNGYIERGWTMPEQGRAKLYEGISGTLTYLRHRKKLIKKTPAGYYSLVERAK